MNKGIQKNRIGTLSELRACIWLMEQGYEVYRNVSSHGNFDVIAIKGDEIRKIDVGTASINNMFSARKQEKARANGGMVLYVLPGGSCKWDSEQDELYAKTQHNCLICSVEFISRRKNRKTCGAIECKLTNAKRANK